MKSGPSPDAGQCPRALARHLRLQRFLFVGVAKYRFSVLYAYRWRPSTVPVLSTVHRCVRAPPI